jgi:hypothetical protein
LLPAGYRQTWEEDMVSAYMERAGSTSGSRSLRGERRSVVNLAVRLRVSGSHASPRGLAWRGAVHGFALVALLYLALWAIIDVADRVTGILRSTVSFDAGSSYFESRFTYWVPAFELLWVVAFCCLVLARPGATRVLVLLAFVVQIGVTVAAYRMATGQWGQPSALSGRALVHWAWFAAATAAALAVPRDASTSRSSPARWLWLGGFAMLALVLVSAKAMESAPSYPEWPRSYVNLGVAVHLGLLVAVGVVLIARRDPRWLLALATVGAVFAGGQLLDYVRYLWNAAAIGQTDVSPVSFWHWFDMLLVTTAVASAIVGLTALRRLPRAEPPAPSRTA